jgi:Ran GTPase-activating protein (RanGAP) involved in mRNA processing and transport
MLTRNHSLKEIILSTRSSRDGEFEYFARGFAHNTSVKSLSVLGIGSAEANALVDSLLVNDTLESLDLHHDVTPGAEDATIVEKIWRNHTLRQLTFDSHMSDAATWFPTVLQEKCTLETIDLSENTLELNHCRAICESLRGSSCLQELDPSENYIILDDHGAQTLNDLLENAPLRMMDIGGNQITTQGMAVLANGLRGNSVLRELCLKFRRFSDEGLIHIGEALVENIFLHKVHSMDQFSPARNTSQLLRCLSTQLKSSTVFPPN